MIKSMRPRKIVRLNLNVRCMMNIPFYIFTKLPAFPAMRGKVIVPSHCHMNLVATDDRLLPFDLVGGGGVDCLIAIENINEHDPHMTSTCMTHRQSQTCCGDSIFSRHRHPYCYMQTLIPHVLIGFRKWLN